MTYKNFGAWSTDTTPLGISPWTCDLVHVWTDAIWMDSKIEVGHWWRKKKPRLEFYIDICPCVLSSQMLYKNSVNRKNWEIFPKVNKITTSFHFIRMYYWIGKMTLSSISVFEIILLEKNTCKMEFNEYFWIFLVELQWTDLPKNCLNFVEKAL